MAEKKWTKQQLAAIEAKGGSLLVSAAAGSGKTAVLVERALQMICDNVNPVPADRLLILTFTNAAAQELRARIGARLEAEIMQKPAEHALKKQRLLLKRAFIGTMDAFCQQLVREKFAQLNLQAGIKLGDAAALSALSGEVMAEVMEEMYADKDFAEFAALYDRARSDKRAEECVLELYSYTRTLPFPEKYIEHFAAMYDTNESLEQTEWGRELLKYAKDAVKAAEELCAQAIILAEDELELQPYLAALLEDKAYIEQLEQNIIDKNWDKCKLISDCYSFPTFKAIRGYEGQNKTKIAEYRNTYKDILKKLSENCFVCTEQEFKEDTAKAALLVKSLCKATKLYAQRYFEAKLGEETIDFNDFQHLALQLLANDDLSPTQQALLISARYDAVMVDEYQDTNELQAAIYNCLGTVVSGTENTDITTNKNCPNNLFYVGDVKQSIYRFRKAEPDIFLQKKHTWQPYGSGQWPAVINLGHNFRSSKGVIDGVNYIFSQIMSEKLGEIEYNDEEKLIQGGSGESENGLELYVLDDEEQLGEADFIASKIKEMVEQGNLVGAENEKRPCNYGDFCILLRARSRVSEFGAALQAQGIPFIAEAGAELLTTPEVMPLISMLAAIDNPGDDISLAAALSGPFFAFTADELLEMRVNAKNKSLWGALVAHGSQKTEACIAEFGRLRAFSLSMSVGDLCAHIADKNSYAAAVLTLPGGQARLENLRRFVEWAQEASAQGRGGIAAFLRMLENSKGPEAPSAKSLAGHVSIMTIHKSKGLEFPVCILADAARSFNRTDLIKRVQIDSVLGIGMQLKSNAVLYPTAQLMAIRAKAQRQSISEEMRVLYVALTRAKNKAIICFCQKKADEYIEKKATLLYAEKPNAFLLSRAAAMADWIVSAALLHPMAAPLLKAAGGTVLPQSNTESSFLISLEKTKDYIFVQQNNAEQEAHEQGTVEEKTPEQAKLVKNLANSFDKEPPRQVLAEVALKLSVSSLVKTEGSHILKRPSFMYEDGFTAAEKGSAQHAFMQFANFEQANNSIEAEVNRLSSEGFISPKQAEFVDKQGIAKFFASPLYARMCSADRLMRELDFLSSIKAGEIEPTLSGELANEELMLQGIADIVIIKNEKIEIADYKTDKNTSPQALLQKYARQLMLYARALQSRFEMPVTKLTIWSFWLNDEVDVPLEQ